MKRLLKSLVPRWMLDRYHWLLAKFAAVRYGHPSRKMIVVGVTGTNGKTTVSNMIARILDEAGFRTGVATTVNFKIADKDRLNDKKMTMLGRTALQKLLAEMADAKCDYAVVETSSEGIMQHRHAGIDYDAAIFTNLTPEHLESHGGFENYKQAKGELFAKIMRDVRKRLRGADVPKVIVANLGSPHAPYFLKFPANKKFGFLVERAPGVTQDDAPKGIAYPLAIVKALQVQVTPRGSQFKVRDVPFTLRMLGRHNVENAMAAITYGLSQGIALETMSAALAKLPGVPGRLELISEGQDWMAIVDYAPEPESMRKLYDVVALLPKTRVIHVLGSAGGGRDKDRRPVLGALAGRGADVVIVTNEDPYDDDPMGIIADVAAGARDAGKTEGKDLFLIEDRAAAIQKAVSLAATGDLVLVTGKGAEQAICVAEGKTTPWDDRAALRKAITERHNA